jgi:Growth inhibitor
VVLTDNTIGAPLSHLTVALITGTPGPASTHVPVDADAGLRRYRESYVDCTELHTIRKARLRRRLGLLSGRELLAVEARIREILGLN